jgi:hypothetical protein
VKSPYHNPNDILILLAETLTAAIKNNEDLTRDRVYQTLFPSEEINDKKLRKLSSDLIELYQNFLIQEELSSNSLLKYELLLQSIQENKIDILQEKARSNAARYFQREPERSGDFFNHKYAIEKSIYNLQTEYEKKMIKKGANRNLSLEDLNNDLDQFYIIEKLRLACDLIAWQRIYKITDRPFEVEIILRMVDRGELLKNPVLSAYIHIYNMLIDRDAQSHYEQLKELMSEHIYAFPKEEMREIYDSVFTYHIGHLSKDGEYHLNELLATYDFAIDNNIITENNFISPTTFRNYVIAGLRANQYDRVEKFITNKSTLLKEEHRETAVNFCLARLYWYQKEWQRVIQQIAIVEFKDTFYSMDAKMMLASSYYELDELDTLEYLLDAFYTSLNRNKDLSEKKIDAYKQFIAFTKKLVKVRSKDKVALDILSQQVQDTAGLHGKSWLLEKVNQKQ